MGDDNGCTYGGLHPCVITDDFLCNAHNLCSTYLLRNTNLNASDDNGCTYGGLHFCAITSDDHEQQLRLLITGDDHGQQLRPLIIDFVGKQQAAVMGLHRRLCKPNCNVISSWIV